MASSGGRSDDGHPHPVKIVSYSQRKNKFVLENENLDKILLQRRYRDMKVAVIAFSGASRIGKSFTLSYLLKFVNNGYWLGEDYESLRGGFKWTSSHERETVGIYAWSELIECHAPHGRKVALMLLDSQGYFDGKTDKEDQAILFALSTMLSSVQVFNVKGDLQDDQLHFLNHFIEYGRNHSADIHKMSYEDYEKPFQSIYFLIRDWCHTSLQLGCEGGNEYITNVLETSGRPSDQVSNRRAISECFEQVQGFLLPSPGNGLLRDDFNGQLKYLDEMFVQYLDTFLRTLTLPDNLQEKRINGREANCLTLRRYFQICEPLLTKKGKQWVSATLELGINQGAHAAAYQEAINMYMMKITEFVTRKSKLTEMELILKHSCLLDEAVSLYNTTVSGKSCTSSPEDQEKYRFELQEAIGKAFNNVVVKKANICEDLSEEEVEGCDGFVAYVHRDSTSDTKGERYISSGEEEYKESPAEATESIEQKEEIIDDMNKVTDDSNQKKEEMMDEMIQDTDESFWTKIATPITWVMDTAEKVADVVAPFLPAAAGTFVRGASSLWKGIKGIFS